MEWTEKALAWKQTMEEFAADGRSRKEFCRERGIRLSTFDYWRMRIRRTEEPQAQVVRVGLVTASAEQLQRVLCVAASL